MSSISLATLAFLILTVRCQHHAICFFVNVQHSEAYNKVVLTTALKIFIFVFKLMTHSLSLAKTPDALPIRHSTSSKDVMKSSEMDDPM